MNLIFYFILEPEYFVAEILFLYIFIGNLSNILLIGKRSKIKEEK